jgi:hypothetical protein
VAYSAPDLEGSGLSRMVLRPVRLKFMQHKLIELIDHHMDAAAVCSPEHHSEAIKEDAT